MKEKSQHTAEYQAGGRLAKRPNRLPGKLLIQNHPFARILRSARFHHFVNVRIYYQEMQFIRAFARILPMQFCSTHCTKPPEISVRLVN